MGSIIFAAALLPWIGRARAARLFWFLLLVNLLSDPLPTP
jgi:hypothetical protein